MKRTFGDFLRATFKGVLDPIGRLINKTGITPITVTLLGVVGPSQGGGREREVLPFEADPESED